MTVVLHLTHTSVPDDARILRELGALGGTPGMKVHAFGLRERPDTPGSRAFALRQFRVLSARATWLPRPVRYALVLLEINTLFAARMVRISPDIVHCHDTMVLPAGALAKLLCRSTLVYDAHELESDKGGQSRALSKATWWIERACWPLVDALITVSPSIVAWYNKNLGGKTTLCLLNSPEIAQPAVRNGATQHPELRDRIGIARDVPLFVYVGALDSGRGIELLLETFTTTNTNAQIAFIGDGRLKAEILRIHASHSNVHHCDPVPHDTLVSFIHDANGAFCLIEDVSLSDHYCLPNKLFEYAFAGLPVVASRLPDIEATVKEYNLGVCVDLNRTSVSAAIDSCIAIDRVCSTDHLKELSWEAQLKNLRVFYANLLSASAGEAVVAEGTAHPRIEA